MSEKRTLSRWLRSEEVYREKNSKGENTDSSHWREALLLEFDPMTSISSQSRVSAPEGLVRIQPYHLIWLALAGMALFLMGWLFGSQLLSIKKISSVSPWIWVGGSLAGSMVFLYWNRMKKRRGIM